MAEFFSSARHKASTSAVPCSVTEINTTYIQAADSLKADLLMSVSIIHVVCLCVCSYFRFQFINMEKEKK